MTTLTLDLNRPLPPELMALLGPKMREATKDKTYQLLPLGEDVAAYLRAKKPRMAENTRKTYESSLDKLARHFPDLRVEDFEPPVGTERLEEFLDWYWGKGAPATYNVHHARWRILTVHHLDGNKANCRWWNLAALCQRCHLQIQGKVQMARVWPWEHSGWFKPYVAGYYAAVYLGEELERPAVEARLDELLALERAVA